MLQGSFAPDSYVICKLEIIRGHLFSEKLLHF